MSRSRQADVTSEGEKPELVKIVFRDSEGKAIEVQAPAPGACPEDPDYLLSIAWTTPQTGPASDTFGPAEFAMALDTLLDTAPDTPATRYRRYFAKLNLHTHPDLIDTLPSTELSNDQKRDRRVWVDWMLSSLRTRVIERARAYDTNPVCPVSITVPAFMENRVIELSKIQLDVADEFFVANGAFDLTAFQEAYQMFANGQLRLQLPNLAWTTQPSSGYFFFFAEFALLAIDQGIAAANRWRTLAPALVRAQHVFARVYRPSDPTTAVFDSYRSCDYDPLQIYSAIELAQLAATYPYPTDDAVCRGAAKNAVDYLPGLLVVP